MRVHISSIGLATAQGRRTDVLTGTSLRPPEPWPWPTNEWTTSNICRPAAGIDSKLTGLARWQALLKMALVDCFPNEMPSPATPVFIGSCNGSADGAELASWSSSFDSVALLEQTPWRLMRVPVFSSSCNSGLHALYAAVQTLKAGASEAVVIAADILSKSNQNNFESLRVLAGLPETPWQDTSSGFVLGEAAVVLKIMRDEDHQDASGLLGPLLANDLNGDGGLSQVLDEINLAEPKLILGQGTGPRARDEAELTALGRAAASSVPISTPLVSFGHTLGASGLLSVALAAMQAERNEIVSALSMPAGVAIDGRPFARSSEKLAESGSILITCGALDGSCVAVVLGKRESKRPRTDSDTRWRPAAEIGPLMHPVLRRIADEACSHRPATPPVLLVVSMDQPLAPPAEAWFGDRLLPSAVLEMTPGIIPQLIARAWGFSGPAICQVGHAQASDASWSLLLACKEQQLALVQVKILGTGDNRDITWNT